MTDLNTSFEDWFAEVKRMGHAEYEYSLKALESFDEEAWRDLYYESHMTPKEALFEDQLAAQ